MLNPTALPLESSGTRLRRMNPSDAAAYAEGTRDGSVREYGHLPEPEYTPESVQAMILEQVEPALSAGTLGILTLADAETDDFVGSLVLFDVDDESAEVGFWIHPAARGCGHARRGLELAATFARDSGLHMLTARTVPDNHGSQHCLRKSEFTETARGVDTTPSGRRETLIHYRRSLYPDPQLPLRSERLLLRLHQPDDAGWLHSLYSSPDTTMYLLDEPWTSETTPENLEKRLSKTGLGSDGAALALVIEKDGTPIGDVGIWLTDREHGQAELGWVIAPEYGGRGYATEAVHALVALAFEHYRLHRLTAQMDGRNAASAALARRIGMRLEAQHLQDWFSKGEWTDTLVFALLASETGS